MPCHCLQCLTERAHQHHPSVVVGHSTHVVSCCQGTCVRLLMFAVSRVTVFCELVRKPRFLGHASLFVLVSLSFFRVLALAPRPGPFRPDGAGRGPQGGGVGKRKRHQRKDQPNGIWTRKNGRPWWLLGCFCVATKTIVGCLLFCFLSLPGFPGFLVVLWCYLRVLDLLWV